MKAIWRFRWIAFIWIIGVVLAGGAVVASLPSRYRAQALVAINLRHVQYSNVGTVLTPPQERIEPEMVRSEATILGNETIIRQVVTDLDLTDNPAFAAHESLRAVIKRHLGMLATPTDRFEDVVAAYRRALSVFTDGRSYIITVAFDSTDAALAAQIVNRHVALFLAQQRGTKDAAVAGATAWLGREVGLLSTRLSEQRAAAQAFRVGHNLPSSGGVSLIEAQLKTSQDNLTHLHDELLGKQARLAQVQRGGTDAMSSGSLSKLRADEVETTRLLAQQQVASGVSSPAVQQIRAGMVTLQQAIASETQRIRQELAAGVAIDQQNETTLQKEVEALQNRLLNAERDESTAVRFERDASITQTLYETLLNKQREVLTQIGIQQSDSRLVASASVPVQAVFPNRLLLMAGLLVAALASALGIVVGLQRLRPRIDRLEDLDHALGFRALGAIPRISSRGARGRLALADMIVRQPRSLAAESVRSMRASLSTRGAGVPQTIAITSALPGEGKTSLALGLARSLTSSGLSVLLVEADLRRGKLAELIWQTKTPRAGLIAFAQGVPLAKAVREDKDSALHILAAEAHPISPQDVISSSRMRDLLQTARETYDYVIVDTPPVNAVADALFVAQQAAATIVVVRAHHTPAVAVATALQALHEAGITGFTAVLNQADPRGVFRNSYMSSNVDQKRRDPAHTAKDRLDV